MKRWGVAVGLVVATDASLRLLGHLVLAPGIGRALLPGLHVAVMPGPPGGGLGLGPLAWAGVCLALALLAAAAFLFTAALLEARDGAAFRLGGAAALVAIATSALDVGEWLLAGPPLSLLAWRPEGPGTRLLGPGDVLLPTALLALGLAWAWLGLRAPGRRGP